VTSQTRIAASRGNARRSHGPRTADGKSRVARNALRHGLYAIKLCDPALAPRIEAVATKLCAGDANPLLREQALIFAENQVLLARVRAARLDAIERRLRDGGTTDEVARAASPDPPAEKAKRPGQRPLVDPRVEFDAVMEAMPEIERLDRFERRAWRDRSRALRAFISVKARS
jgi:hypothetical protein